VSEKNQKLNTGKAAVKALACLPSTYKKEGIDMLSLETVDCKDCRELLSFVLLPSTAMIQIRVIYTGILL